MQDIDLLDANTATQGWDLNFLGEIGPVLQSALESIMTNVNPAEWGLIILLAGLAFFFLRANFWLQMILKFMAVLFVVIIFGIVFGVISL